MQSIPGYSQSGAEDTSGPGAGCRRSGEPAGREVRSNTWSRYIVPWWRRGCTFQPVPGREKCVRFQKQTCHLSAFLYWFCYRDTSTTLLGNLGVERKRKRERVGGRER